MPLSELHPMAKSKLESTQQHRPIVSSTDLSFAPDNDFVELVWENGQVMMQNQSSRARKNPTSNSLPSHIGKPREKDAGNATNGKAGRFGNTDSGLSDLPLLVPTAEMGFNQEDDMVPPWFNYSINDSLQNDYCTDFLPEVSEVTLNEPNTHNNFASVEKSSGYSPVIRDSNDVCTHNGSILERASVSKVCYGDAPRPGSHLYPSLSQAHTSVTSLRPRTCDVNSNSTSSASNTSVSSSSSNVGIQASGLPSVSCSVVNFSHFARPAALAKVNLQSIGAVAASDLSSIDRDVSKDKAAVLGSSKHCSSMTSIPAGTVQNEVALRGQPNFLPKTDVKSAAVKPFDEPTHAERSDAACVEKTIKVDKSPNQGHAASSVVGMPDAEKIVEPVVASSSVCSGNSLEGGSNDRKRNMKRKCLEIEESEGPSDDVEEESVGVRKSAPARAGSSSKRSRAAEVHNLSERRRRDRINEKMRALQELIPNCNKVDKASMLDEAIEYLKTLQLQVQIMSMGSGFCMPPVMFPTGMQHMHMAHMGQFSHMGVGMGMGMNMGMGMGFGMGMIDMSGGSSGCPMFQASPMQGPHFSGPPITAATNFHLFGVPGQGLPMSMPRSPFIPMSGGLPVKSSTEMNPSGEAADVHVSDSVHASSSKNLPQNINPQAIQKTNSSWPMNEISSQGANENFADSALVQKHD